MTKNIYQKLLDVMADVRYIQKENKTVNNQYRFVSHDAVTAATSEAFIKHGIYARPFIVEKDIKTITIKTKFGEKECFICQVVVEYTFINIDKTDETITVNGIGQGIDDQDKACGKAISYACKYALLKALGIETGEDPEKDVDYSITSPVINAEQVKELQNLLKEAEISLNDFCKVYKINSVNDLPDSKFENAKQRLVTKAQEVMARKNAGN